MNKRLIITLSILCLLLYGCSKRGDASHSTHDQEGPVNVVATTGMIGDAVKNIGKEHVTVTALMGPGIDPHLYKASEGDVARMSGASIIFYNGLHLEGKMSEVFEQMYRLKPTIGVAEVIDAHSRRNTPLFAGNVDPHVWFDVTLWMKVAGKVADELVRYDPQNKEAYRANLETYLAELKELDAYVREKVATIPEDKRVLVTAHDAFGYFGEAYGFEVRGLQGISTVAEAGAGDVQSLADYIVKRQIPAIFVESSVPPRYIQALQAAVKSRGFNVVIGGNLFSDAMGNPGTPEGTYLGMVRHNIDTIAGALSGARALTLNDPEDRRRLIR